MQRPDWLLQIPADEYHAATKRNEFTTSHRLNLFRKCPALYKKTIDGEIVEGDTAAFQLGRATHTLILEGKEKFAAEFTVSDGPVNPKTGEAFGRTTKTYREWAAEQTKPVVCSEDFDLIAKMRDAVHAHKVAADLLKDGFAEGTIRTKWRDEPVQARLDWFNPERNIIVDLKTCADVDRFGFDVCDHGYVMQMAFYAHCVYLSTSRPPKAYLVAVEKKEPFRVAVVEICALTLEDANLATEAKYGYGNDLMLSELLKCRADNVWPTRYEEVSVI